MTKSCRFGFNSVSRRRRRALGEIPDSGIAGLAGLSEKGKHYQERTRGYSSDCGEIWGNPLRKLEEVQISDECPLIVPKLIISRVQFDEGAFDGRHCCGANCRLCVK